MRAKLGNRDMFAMLDMRNMQMLLIFFVVIQLLNLFLKQLEKIDFKE
jgi:hypothetical protein